MRERWERRRRAKRLKPLAAPEVIAQRVPLDKYERRERDLLITASVMVAGVGVMIGVRYGAGGVLMSVLAETGIAYATLERWARLRLKRHYLETASRLAGLEHQLETFWARYRRERSPEEPTDVLFGLEVRRRYDVDAAEAAVMKLTEPD